MPKQQIEIDVPEGFEVDHVLQSQGYLREFVGGQIPDYIENIVGEMRYFFKRKQPQFIEVREYLYRLSHDKGYRVGVVVRNTNDRSPSKQEEYMGSYFIRWIDHDWRKVEI